MLHEPEFADLFDELFEAGGWWNPKTCREKCWRIFERLSLADRVLAVMAARMIAGGFESEDCRRGKQMHKPQTNRPALHNWLKNRRFDDEAETLLQHHVWATDVSEVPWLREQIASLKQQAARLEAELERERDQRCRAIKGLGALSDLMTDSGLYNVSEPPTQSFLKPVASKKRSLGNNVIPFPGGKGFKDDVAENGAARNDF